MVFTLLRWAFKLLCAALAVAIPLLAVWLASSYAAYRNGPVWLAVTCGLLVPLVPLLWDGLSRWRTSRGRALRAKVLRSEALRPQDGLTFADRYILRLLVVSLIFLGILIVRSPQTTFASLSTRGDWFLDGREGPTVDRVRAGLFMAAERLQWLYNALGDDNPYKDLIDPKNEAPTPPVPEDSKQAPLERTPEKTPPTKTDPTSKDPPKPAEPELAPDGRPLWPLPSTLHPLVLDMPAESEKTLEDAAKYIAANEPNRWMRIKALHDYVADRVAYDTVAYFTQRNNMPPQDALTVFRTRTGVCAGYAQLLAAMGVAAGEEIVVVVGDARTESSDLTGEGHAWNAAQIDGAWYLIDPTWDSGHLEGQEFVKAYTTSNLFTPPTVFSVTHFPDETRWQLSDPPISRGDFFRQPVMRPEFFATGLELISPTRSQVDVEGPFDVKLKRPEGRYLLARYKTDDGVEGRCTVTYAAETTVHCPLPGPATYQVDLFGSPVEVGTYNLIGQFEVHRAGS